MMRFSTSKGPAAGAALLAALFLSGCTSELETPMIGALPNSHSVDATHSPAAPASTLRAVDADAPPAPLRSAFNLAFTASAPAAVQPVSTSRTGPQDGQTYSGDALIDMLRAREASTTQNQPLFERSTLSLVFRDRGTGEVRRMALAECESLDFMSDGPQPFEDQTVCDGARYSYGVGGQGLQVTRDGSIVMQLPLEPGRYSLNGVRFEI
ncbi:MAG: hypothetical protein KI785_14635 [Devosiaceae bacterium]|nr:hypothetical protein [Devosiaceae bacterium MH13]